MILNFASYVFPFFATWRETGTVRFAQSRKEKKDGSRKAASKLFVLRLLSGAHPNDRVEFFFRQ